MPKKYRKINKREQVSRKFILTVSMFLLAQEELRSLFWDVKSVDYNHIAQTIKIGIESTTGKYGTTLVKLRKYSKSLSDYLFEQGLTFRKGKVTFFVDREEMEIKRIYNIIDKVENV
jgi:hypothetical protein